MTDVQQRNAARAFSNFWGRREYEKGEGQQFWTSLLRDVYGIAHPDSFMSFEEPVKLDHTSFIDCHIRSMTYIESYIVAALMKIYKGLIDI